MPSPQFPGQIRLVLKIIAISAVIGAAYSTMRVMQDNGPLFSLYGMARGAVTGVVIGGALPPLKSSALTGR